MEGCHTLLKVLVVCPLLLEQVHLILQVLDALLVRLQVLLELGHVLDLFLVYVNDSCSVLECSDLLLFHVQFILYRSQFLRSLQLISLLLSSKIPYPLASDIYLPFKLFDSLNMCLHLFLANIRGLCDLLFVYLDVFLELFILDLALLELLSHDARVVLVPQHDLPQARPLALHRRQLLVQRLQLLLLPLHLQLQLNVFEGFFVGVGRMDLWHD